MKPWLDLVDWGVVDYGDALGRQRALFDESAAARAGHTDCGGTIVFCEHNHVYTLGKSGKAENLLVSEDFLHARGATLHRTERGGDITYHGPGQVVCYPIVDLGRLGIGLRDYIAALERAVIDTLAEWGVVAGRVPGKTGVWVGGVPTKETRGTTLAKDNQPAAGGGVGLRVADAPGEAQVDKLAPNAESCAQRKICAIGVKASRNIVMHGLALNVSTDLSWFELINPCGTAGAEVTSMERETGREIALEKVKKELAAQLLAHLTNKNIK